MANRAKPSFPRLNLSHPLAQGLIMDFPMFEGAGNKNLELLSNSQASFSNTPIWKNTPYGYGFDFSAATDKTSFTNTSAQQGFNAISIETLVFPRTSGGGAAASIIRRDNGTTRWVVRLDPGTNSYAFTMVYSGNSPGWGSDNGTYTNNNWAHVIVTHPNMASTSAVPTFYINGVIKNNYGFQVTPSGTINADVGTTLIGNNSTNIRNFDGTIEYVRVWNRVLSETEAKQLYADPFQIYKKKTFSLQ